MAAIDMIGEKVNMLMRESRRYRGEGNGTKKNVLQVGNINR